MNLDAIATGSRRVVGALLFETGFFGAIGLFSAFMSSPWTIERTAKSPDASEATRKYILLAHITNLVAGAFVSAWSRSIAPLAGAALGTGYMGLVYRYSRAQGLQHASFDINGFEADAAANITLAGGRRSGRPRQ